MDVAWYCYRFDYDRFLRLRPMLRAAATPAALAALTQGFETDFRLQARGDANGDAMNVDTMVEAIVDSLDEGDATLSEARAALVCHLCCRGEPLPFDNGLPRAIAGLQRASGMEEAGELLSAMLTGGRNMEPWMIPSAGLAGFLTPQEASALYVSLVAWRAQAYSRRHTRAGRPVGGLFAAGARLMRHLLNLGPLPEETLRLVGQLLHEAASQQEGIAAVAIRGK
jgi:hypothetical protein